jgi:hypothetical protein
MYSLMHKTEYYLQVCPACTRRVCFSVYLGRVCLSVSVGRFIAERILRQDEKKNQRFFDGYMVRSSVVEADLQRELERER